MGGVCSSSRSTVVVLFVQSEGRAGNDGSATRAGERRAAERKKSEFRDEERKKASVRVTRGQTTTMQCTFMEKSTVQGMKRMRVGTSARYFSYSLPKNLTRYRSSTVRRAGESAHVGGTRQRKTARTDDSVREEELEHADEEKGGNRVSKNELFTVLLRQPMSVQLERIGCTCVPTAHQ